ncbi:hypothetical protein CANINC_004848 [Pichia inconspicua]|uniref:Uncharacterized protein n=1 Tax=Pichia inconspicua TaxID=52247 RepID=A0A4T0WUW4_9ASCO|nr:hypothetical protein CANINC_004848 [[Candida] inconspicua]
MNAIQDLIRTVEDVLLQSKLMVFLMAINFKYIVKPLTKYEFTSHLVAYPQSRFITIGLVYLGLLLAIYELGLNLGVKLGLWKNPAHEVFKEIPVHCAHVYVSINMIKEEDSKIKSGKPKYLLKYPIVYHFEFSPEEYAHEEYGTDLKFLKSKVYDWFSSSEVFLHNKDSIKKDLSINDLKFYNKKREILVGDDEYLCDLGIATGETIFCLIYY